MKKTMGRNTYEVLLVGDVPNEGCGQAKGMVMCNTLNGAVKQVVMLLGVGLGIQLTEVTHKDSDIDIRKLIAVGSGDHDFEVYIEEVNVVVMPSKKRNRA